ncbi:unnamed protein product [Phytophthora fragariaefolia]|uniref:Unnamed protein product n=1 Tax=Phytophthora fragariaefolia TaxID=1490495 RepID=A0A9W7CP25_9STRA|nr:unnamed protein product [Phytophthora fragariaefolia]
MAKDIDLDLRDEAVAAADIDPEEEVTEAQFDGLTGIAPVVTENNAVDNGNDASITAAASADAAAVENQQSVQDLDTCSGISIAAPKRRRGRPRKNVPPVTGDDQRPAAEITDQHDATEASHDQRTAADESAADVRPTKRRRTKVVAAAPTDAIARRTRMQTQRDPRTDADRSNDRCQIDDANRATSRSRVSIMADHESAATRRPSSPEVSGLSNSATAQKTATPRGDAEPVTEANARLAEQPQLQTTSPRQTKAATEEEAQMYVFASTGRQGVDSFDSPQPRLDRIRPDEAVVERRRRRYRTHTGRYTLEFKIECVGHRPDERARRTWINQRDYEQLWRDRRLQSIADSEYDAPQAEHDAE